MGPLRFRIAALAAIVGPILIASLVCLPQLDRSAEQVRELRDGSLTALRRQGDLQYQIQESRVHLLRVLLAENSSAQRSTEVDEEIARIRQADVEISILAGKAILQGSAKGRVEAFVDLWEKYASIRDETIALALQGRIPEARRMEITSGARAFREASDCIVAAKQTVDDSAVVAIHQVVRSLRFAWFELLALLGLTLTGAGLLLGSDLRHRKTLGRLERASLDLAESEERFTIAFRDAAVGILLLDTEGRIVDANRAAAEVTGYGEKELVGRIALTVGRDAATAAASEFDLLVKGAKRRSVLEFRIARKDGRPIWVRYSLSLLQAKGDPWRFFALCEDITDWRDAQDKLKHQATHDILTGLPNRLRFETELELLLARSERLPDVLYLDLDGFKYINDTMGHTLGDQLLRAVAARLSDIVAEQDLLARIGGDEFAVLTRADGDRAALEGQASRILDALRRPIPIGRHEFHVSVSIGVATSRLSGRDRGILLSDADSAMYEAKRSGKDRYCFFVPEMRRRAIERLQIENQLRTAVEKSETRVVFQAQYSIRTGALLRFEALCRWTSPALGDIPPSQFIPIAEETGMIVSLGEWVLREACVAAHVWHRAGRAAPVAVNISPVQFARPTFVQTVCGILSETGLPPELLELEITEGVLIRDFDEAMARIKRLREMGVSIAIDDFGVGYSSLGYIRRLALDVMKIDRQFVRGIENNPAQTAMLRSLLEMARALGMRTVVEGVETERELEVLRDIGCDEVQGYLYGRPESFTLATERLLASRGQYGQAMSADGAPVIEAEAFALT